MAKMKSLPSDALERLYAGEFGVQWKEKAPFSSVDIDYATKLLNSIVNVPKRERLGVYIEY